MVEEADLLGDFDDDPGDEFIFETKSKYQRTASAITIKD